MIDFSYLMDTSVALDKKLDSKLNTVSSLLPMKLQELFQAVEKKTHSIAEDVAKHREKHVLAKDIVKSLPLKGSHPIPMSQSLSACESNIVQFFVVLDRHLPDVSTMRMARFFLFFFLLFLFTLWSDSTLQFSLIPRCISFQSGSCTLLKSSFSEMCLPKSLLAQGVILFCQILYAIY